MKTKIVLFIAVSLSLMFVGCKKEEQKDLKQDTQKQQESTPNKKDVKVRKIEGIKKANSLESIKKVENRDLKVLEEAKIERKDGATKVVVTDREQPEVDCEEIFSLMVKNEGKGEALGYITEDCISNTEYSESITETLGVTMRKDSPKAIEVLSQLEKKQADYVLKRMETMLIDSKEEMNELVTSFSKVKDSELKKKIEKDIIESIKKAFATEVEAVKEDSKDPKSFTGKFSGATVGAEKDGFYVTLTDKTGKKMVFKAAENPEIAYFDESEKGIYVENKELVGSQFTIYYNTEMQDDVRGEKTAVNVYINSEVTE
ncbi:hypothetical protein JXR93_02425 [bacterium]|nr:hypothetical protein [bacterium]